MEGYICSKHNMLELEEVVGRLDCAGYLLKILLDGGTDAELTNYWMYTILCEIEDISTTLHLFEDSVYEGTEVNPV